MQVNGKLRPNAVDENEPANERQLPAGQIKRNENFLGEKNRVEDTERETERGKECERGRIGR